MHLVKLSIKLILLAVLLFGYGNSYAQADIADTVTLRMLFDSINLSNKANNWDKSIELTKKTAILANSMNDRNKEALAYLQTGNAYFSKGLTIESLEYYHKSYEIRLKSDDLKGLSGSLNAIGRAYMNLGNYPLALSFYIKGLEVSDKIKDTLSSSRLLYNIGVICYHRKEFEKGLEYLNQSWELANAIDSKRMIGNIHKTRGTIYTEMGSYTSALNEYSLALNILKEIDDKADLAALLNNIGYLFYNQGDYELALKNHFESLDIKVKSNNQRGVANSYHSIGETYFAMGKYSKALHYANLALHESRRLNIMKLQESSYKLLSEINSKIGNYKEAYTSLANRFVLYDSIHNDETTRRMMQLELNYEFEKKLQQQQVEQSLRESILTEESRRNRLAKNGLIIVIVLISSIVSISTYSYFVIRGDNKKLLKQKDEMEMQKEEMETQRDALEKLNSDLKQKTYEVLEQRDEIEYQRDLVTLQKREITDSIAYAQRIQQAILPARQTVSKIFPESFIVYLPKNVVSGDFYWVSRIGKHKLIAVADCTGHGVPGGFMSMLGVAYLNEVVTNSRVTSPNKVLNQIRNLIIESLHQSSNPLENFDGMDMSFCSINDETLELEFAGANSSIFISRQNTPEGKEQILQLMGDRMPVSMHIRMDQFTNKTVQLAKGDMLYLFTDGFTDQFGGSEGRKYNFRRFKNLIEAVDQLPVDQQFQIIERTFTKWKGDHYQVDDVLVLGIRI